MVDHAAGDLCRHCDYADLFLSAQGCPPLSHADEFERCLDKKPTRMSVKESCLACENAIESPSRVWPHEPTSRRGKDCFLVPAAFSILVRHASRADPELRVLLCVCDPTL